VFCKNAIKENKGYENIPISGNQKMSFRFYSEKISLCKYQYIRYINEKEMWNNYRFPNEGKTFSNVERSKFLKIYKMLKAI
jgi:hypothetical protein